jgi:DNA polymerase I-like protein with 3'-5' exonuclease and polymerase domains
MKIKVITETEKQEQAIRELNEISKICLDTETTGLQATLAKCRLLQLCDASPDVDDRTVYVFDLFKVKPDKKLKDLIESRDLLVIHNANFDLQFLYQLGIDYKGKVFDTYLAERVLRAGFKEKRISPQANKPYFADVSCSLKAVVERRLELQIDKEQQVSDWGAVDLDLEQIEYAAKDVDLLPRIAALQIEELKQEDLMGIYSLESKVIRPVARMCYEGFAVDVEKLKKLEVEIQNELDEVTKNFVENLDSRLPEELKLPRCVDGSLSIGKKPKKEFNPSSTTQVCNAFTACGIDLPEDDKTKKKTLSQIALSEFNSDDPTLALYRQRVKIETKLEHITKLISNINPVTNRIHSFYNQFGANSGRFTCTGAKQRTKKAAKTTYAVNLQQVPRSKNFRECFVAGPGRRLVICDYSQMELRLLAELADIPEMQQAYNKDIDLHTLTASLMNDCRIEDVSKQQRQMAKGANFGMIYGIGYARFKTYAAASFGLMLSLSESKVTHAKFHSSYPRLRQWHRERGALVQDGWCFTRTALGRRRLLSYDDAKMTIAANTLIQGTGADILKVALGELNEYVDDKVKLVAVVHDEIVLEVKEDLAAEWQSKLSEMMVRAGDSVFKKTMLVAEAGIGDDWSAK